MCVCIESVLEVRLNFESCSSLKRRGLIKFKTHIREPVEQT